MRTSVIQVQNAEELRRQLEEFREQEAAGSRTPARLAMAFASDRLLEPSVLRPFVETGFQVFGSCSAEEIVGGRVAAPSIVALLIDLPEDAFDLKIFQPAEGVTIETLGRALGRHMRDRFDDPVALVLDRTKVDVQGVAISGWQEPGTPKRITRSEGSKVLEIEGQPVTEFYENYFNIKTSDARSIRNNVDPELLATSEYPILLRRADGADALLMFNCAVRSRSFDPCMNRELEVIHKLWGAPMVGFSSWGEIGQTPGHSCGFHYLVFSMVALRDCQSEHASHYASMDDAEVEELVKDGHHEDELSAEELRKAKATSCAATSRSKARAAWTPAWCPCESRAIRSRGATSLLLPSRRCRLWPSRSSRTTG